MYDHSAFALSAGKGSTDQVLLTPRERSILRSLAGRVAELAARPGEQAKHDLWYLHNSLQPTRPLVFCDPENGWNEIIAPKDLACTSELGRRWELMLRKEVFWGEEMRDDRVIVPFFSVQHIYRETDWGMHETKISGGDGGAYTWIAPLNDYRDIDKLHAPEIELDMAATERALGLAQDLLGDLLGVRLKTSWWWSLGMTWTLINLRGLGQMMLDMLDHPNELHRVMGILRDGNLARLDFLESRGLLSLNNDGTYVGSGGFGWSRELPREDFDGRVRTHDMWGFGESQETVGVSPEMFAEFILPYQLPILERFGLNCYGCCEPLDRRWHLVQQIPRLRRVSVSAWCNVADMAEKLGDRYVFSYKPAPSQLATPHWDEDATRAHVREVMRLTRDCRLEVIMKDNHTLAGDPRRAVRWVQIVREEAESL
ncbi:MAG: uroporphyrinogen decarboxylase/cobalamine-independent methonine synthase family protein [Anaerolineae bacterium]